MTDLDLVHLEAALLAARATAAALLAEIERLTPPPAVGYDLDTDHVLPPRPSPARCPPMIHFPDSFPVDALQVLGPIIRSGGVVPDRISAGEAAYTLLGYGMGLWLGTDHPNVVGGPVVNPLWESGSSLHAAEAALDELEHANPSNLKAGNVGAIGGAQLALWAIELAKFAFTLLMRP